MLYEYKCLDPECEKEKELYLPIAKRNDPQYCICGHRMRLLMSLPRDAVFTIGGRDKVLKTLNKEEGYNMPGGDKHRARYSEAMAQGLERQDHQQGMYRQIVGAPA